MEIIRSSPHAAPMETSDGQVVRSQGGKNARPGGRDLQKFSSSKISNGFMSKGFMSDTGAVIVNVRAKQK